MEKAALLPMFAALMVIQSYTHTAQYDSDVKMALGSHIVAYRTSSLISRNSQFIADQIPNRRIPVTLCQIIWEYALPAWKLKSQFTINEKYYHDAEHCGILYSGRINVLAHMIFKNKPVAISGSDNFDIQLWDPNTGALYVTFQGHKKEVISLAYAHNKKILISGSRDETINLWKLNPDDLLQSYYMTSLTQHKDRIRSIAIAPNETMFASGADDTTVRVWQLPEGTLVNTFIGHAGCIRAVAWNYDGSLLISASEDNTFRIWDVQKRCLLRQFPSKYASSSSIHGLACSPIQNHVAIQTAREIISLQDTLTGTLIQSIRSVGIPVIDRVVAFSPSGTFIASMSCTKGTVSIWHVPTSTLLAQHPKNNGYQGLHFISDNMLAASGKKNGTVNIFSIDD